MRLLDSVPELGATDAGQERVSPDLDRKKRVISRDNLMKQAEQVAYLMVQTFIVLTRFHCQSTRNDKNYDYVFVGHE